MIDLALQEAVDAALRGDAQLAALMGGRVRLYTSAAPAGAPFPHLVHGDDQIIPQVQSCGSAFECYAPVHIWTRDDEAGPEANKALAKQIGPRVRDLLSALTIPGFRVVESRCETARYFTDQDGLTAHGLIEQRYWVEPSA